MHLRQLTQLHHRIDDFLTDAQKTGVAQEAVKTATGKVGQMSPQEAQLILGVDKDASWGDVVTVRLLGTWT